MLRALKPQSDPANRAARELRGALARIARSLALLYLRLIAAVRTDPTTSNVHALRSTTRRVQALLSLLGAIEPVARRRKLNTTLRDPFKACGRVRDLQVTRRSLRTDLISHPELAPLLKHLEQRLRKERRRLVGQLADAHPRRIERRLRKLALEVETPLPRGRGDRTAIQLRSELERSRRSALSTARAATASDADSLHKARLAFKHYRYQVELCRPLALPYASPDIRRLRRLQDALGGITDRQIMLRTIDAYMNAHPKAGRRLLPYRAQVEQARQRLIERDLPRISQRASKP
jgi:CHAD domain-containing protein